jgi:hypothetical protein
VETSRKGGPVDQPGMCIVEAPATRLNRPLGMLLSPQCGKTEGPAWSRVQIPPGPPPFPLLPLISFPASPTPQSRKFLDDESSEYG